MKKTRRFVALLLAAVLALALFTACGAAELTIGEKYEKWFVEQLNSKLPEGKKVQKVNRPDMRAALEKIGEDGKFTAKEGYYKEPNGTKKDSHYWLILTDPRAWEYGVSEAKAVALTPENLTKYGPVYYIKEEHLSRIKEYDIATRVMDGKTYVAVYLCLEKRPS